jgi:D-serine deaminase-like pyridoxal phosphate-dependent protein
MQIEAGAIGVCTATVWEAIAMSRAGIADVFIANEMWGVEKIRCLATEATRGRLSVAVDNADNVDDLSWAVVAAGSKLGVVVDVDVGLGRRGVRSVPEALELARRIAIAPNLEFLGIMGYEGHCMHELDRQVRQERVGEAVGLLGEIVDRLADIGLECKVVSAGGTGTFDITGTAPRVTEIQAGSYVFMDNFHRDLVSEFEQSLTVLSTVVVKHANRIVLDAGNKSIGADHAARSRSYGSDGSDCSIDVLRIVLQRYPRRR